MNEGMRVIDGDDEDPNDAVVVWRPEDMTTADWEYEAGGETYTTAESNPDYDDDEQLVLIAFEAAMDEQWPDWEDTDPADLYEGAKERGIALFGFPESRLEEINEAVRNRPDEFDEIKARLEENEFDVEFDEETGELYVEKYGTEYWVQPDGTVEGDDGLRNRVTSIVNRYL
jgi:hypothetical protein